MTTSRSKGVLVAVLCLLAAACGGASPEDPPPRVDAAEDRPPGVDAGNWIKISEVAGIVLTNVGAPIPVTGPGGVRMAFPTPRNVTGVLMVKLQGAWTRVELELPGPRIQPLL